jgi:PilZ domain
MTRNIVPRGPMGTEQPDPPVSLGGGERRRHARFAMRIGLRLRGTMGGGVAFEETTSTDVVSAGGFGCRCITDLAKGALVDVFLLGSEDRLIGRAQVVAVEPSASSPWRRYSFAFLEVRADWFLVPDESAAQEDDAR